MGIDVDEPDQELPHGPGHQAGFDAFASIPPPGLRPAAEFGFAVGDVVEVTADEPTFWFDGGTETYGFFGGQPARRPVSIPAGFRPAPFRKGDRGAVTSIGCPDLLVDGKNIRPDQVRKVAEPDGPKVKRPLRHLDTEHGIDPNTVEPGDEESLHEQEHDGA